MSELQSSANAEISESSNRPLDREDLPAFWLGSEPSDLDYRIMHELSQSLGQFWLPPVQHGRELMKIDGLHYDRHKAVDLRTAQTCKDFQTEVILATQLLGRLGWDDGDDKLNREIKDRVQKADALNSKLPRSLRYGATITEDNISKLAALTTVARCSKVFDEFRKIRAHWPDQMKDQIFSEMQEARRHWVSMSKSHVDEQGVEIPCPTCVAQETDPGKLSSADLYTYEIDFNSGEEEQDSDSG